MRGVAVSHAPFARTFLHEQAHVLNHAWNVPSLNELSTVDDESLAEEWVHWLGGYTARCESSETDREAKKAGGMLAPTKNTGEVAGIGSAIN